MYSATKPVITIWVSMNPLLGSRCRRADGWRIDEGARPLQGRLGDDFVGPVGLELLLAYQELEKIEHVLGVQLTRVLAEQRGHVEWSDDRHLTNSYDLARLRELAIAAALGGEIDDHRTRLHASDLGRADELGRRPAGHRGGRDDEVGLLDVGGDRGSDLSFLLRGQLARIATFTTGIDAGLDKLGSEGSGLLFGLRPHIVAFDDGAQPMRRGD